MRLRVKPNAVNKIVTPAQRLSRRRFAVRKQRFDTLGDAFRAIDPNPTWQPNDSQIDFFGYCHSPIKG
jgi:hypothetical protein